MGGKGRGGGVEEGGREGRGGREGEGGRGWEEGEGRGGSSTHIMHMYMFHTILHINNMANIFYMCIHSKIILLLAGTSMRVHALFRGLLE